MTPTTPLVLLALFEAVDRWLLSITAKPSTQALNSNDMRNQVRARLRKIKQTATFCAFNLRGYTKKDELYFVLSHAKKEASTALRIGQTLIRPRPLKDFNQRLSCFDTQCVTLLGSVRHAFLLLDPELERRLPAVL